MTRSIFSPQRIADLKLEAKRLVRASGVGHSQALNQIAAREGWANWSLLVKASHAEYGLDPEHSRVFRYTRTLEEQRRAFLVVPHDDTLVSGTGVNRVWVEDLTTKFDSGLTALRYARDYMRNVVQVPRFNIRGRTRGYWEMRQWLPYGVQQIHEGSDLLIAFNRHYKPVGSTNLGEWADYAALPHMGVHIDAALLERVSGGSVGYFFNDGCPPWLNRAMAKQYLDALEQVVASLKR